jgi:hypothetical protein
MIFIDNTGVLRVKNAKLTVIDGTVVLLSEAGTYTIYDSAGNEVPGQVWPANLTLNEPGNYAGVIESDVEFIPGRQYTAIVTFGSEPDTRAVFNVSLRPLKRFV